MFQVPTFRIVIDVVSSSTTGKYIQRERERERGRKDMREREKGLERKGVGEKVRERKSEVESSVSKFRG